jgi:beta-ribofuranosylaminobenzene 5'-phosphate synthase
MRATVETAARLHFGFCNLSLTHERLYGALGVAIDRPRCRVTATPADDVDCPDDDARPCVRRTVDLFDLPGARVRVDERLPRHAGLGSGTQLALAVATAVGRAHGRRVDGRRLAPELGRGGRSGVGVAAFEGGGFVVDAGHPVARFTTDRPADGEWAVPEPVATHAVPDDWRFLLVRPAVDPGRSGDDEDAGMRAAIERASADTGDRVAGVVLRRVLPAVASGAADRFGAAVAEVGRLNGSWYADQQGGVYRPPVGAVVDALSSSPAVYGAGQSSWGPTTYGVTDARHAEAAREAGEAALDEAGVDGAVRLVRGRNRGATVDVVD